MDRAKSRTRTSVGYFFSMHVDGPIDRMRVCWRAVSSLTNMLSSTFPGIMRLSESA